MSKFTIYAYKRPTDMKEAVTVCNTPDDDRGGVIECMRATIDNQNAMMARMLATMFGEYDDHFTGPEYEPKTDAEKLGFILSHHRVTVVPTEGE